MSASSSSWTAWQTCTTLTNNNEDNHRRTSMGVQQRCDDRRRMSLEDETTLEFRHKSRKTTLKYEALHGIWRRRITHGGLTRAVPRLQPDYLPVQPAHGLVFNRESTKELYNISPPNNQITHEQLQHN